MSPARGGSRSQTIATWLALLGGPLGLHRFYLHGPGDRWGWLLWPPTLIGAYGVQRMRALGQDDQIAWLLIPLLGLVIAATMLTAIIYGLTPDVQWRAQFDPAGNAVSWPLLNVIGAVIGLALGATALIASTAFMAQRFFEYQALQRSALQPAPADQTNSQRLRP